MPRRKDGDNTQKKILAASATLFARKGFRSTTVADIAAMAGVNGALINYYYGDKIELYRQAWSFAHAEAMEKYPLYGNLNEQSPAVKRLQAIIVSDIARRSDPENCENDILLNELSSPTGYLADIHAKTVCVLRAALRDAVGEILGDKVPEVQRQMSVLAIFSMCVIPVRQYQQMEGIPEYNYDPKLRAEHVYNFAMAGMLDILAKGNNI